jgi:hypothetical protein
MSFITLRLSAEVTQDHQLVVTLPPELPVGQKLDVEVTLRERATNPPYSRPGLLEWAEQNATDLGPQVRSDDVEGFTGRRV